MSSLPVGGTGDVTPSPKTRRKQKATAKPEVNNVPETESEGKGLEEANLPINAGISKDDVDNIVPCCSEAVLNQPPSDKYHSTPAKIEDRLTERKNINVVDCKNLSEPDNPRKHGKESMYKLDHLAQVCCDKGGFESDNLVFSRRVTRSMNNVPTISVPMANRQDTQPDVVHIEDDVPSTVPDIIHVNNPTFIKENGAKLGKAEVAPSCMDTCISDPKPSFISPQSSGQNIDNPTPPQVANSGHENEEETFQQVLDKAY